MNIRETVLEYWPELSRSWNSAGAAVQFYSKGQNHTALALEIKAAEKLRVRTRTPEEDRNTATSAQWRETGRATDEIRYLSGEGYSVQEIQQLTRATAEHLGTSGDVWSESSIWRHATDEARARWEHEGETQPDEKKLWSSASAGVPNRLPTGSKQPTPSLQ